MQSPIDKLSPNSIDLCFSLNICLMRTDINPEYNTVITTNKISLYETSGSVTFQILSEKHMSIEFGDNLSIGLCIDRRYYELLYYWRSDG
jgi:hypothetical protein